MPTQNRSEPNRFEAIKEIALEVLQHSGEDNIPRLAAAFAFYALLSLAPLLLLAVVVAGMIYGEGMARQELLGQAREYLGEEGAGLVGDLLDNVRQTGASTIATLFSLGVAFFAASNIFVQLEQATNSIWGIEQRGSAFKNLILTRVAAFLSVLVFGALFIGWIALDSWLIYLERTQPGFAGWQVLSLGVTVIFFIGVFMVALHGLPKDRLRWRDTFPGALFCSLGFALSKYLLTWYFSYANVTGAYGTAGAVILLLLAIYYLGQIFFLGVEITYVWAHRRGSLKGETMSELQYS